jgi:hypothetical protein
MVSSHLKATRDFPLVFSCVRLACEPELMTALAQVGMQGGAYIQCECPDVAAASQEEPEGCTAAEIFCTNSSSSSPARSLTAQKSRPSFDQWRTL